MNQSINKSINLIFSVV